MSFNHFLKHTFERIHIKFFSDTESRLNVLPLHALDAEVRKRNGHVVPVYNNLADTVSATFFAHQIVGMRTKSWTVLRDA